MAINKKLINFATRSNFDAQLANNQIDSKSIVFINDTQEIWTHNIFFSGHPSIKLQSSSPGTAQTGNLNITGNGLFGGNVGIGTTNPTSKLCVVGTHDTSVAYFGGNSSIINEYNDLALSSTYHTDLRYAVGVRVTNTVSSPSSLNPRLGLFVQNTNTYLPADRVERFSILSNGNVGIGTATPGAKLEISGSSVNTGISDTLIINGNSATTGYYDSLSFRQGATNTGARITSGNPSGYLGFLSFETSRQTVAGHVTTEAMRINGSGNVGIGTTAPLSKLSINGGLHVGGDSNAGDNNILADGTITGLSFSGAGTGLTGTASSLSIGGNAATATKLANISTSFSGTYPLTVNVNGAVYSHTGMTYNGTSSTLTATNFAGNLIGNAGSATDADKLDGLHKTAFPQYFHYNTTSSGSGWYKIKILSTTTWMVAITVKLYQSYGYNEIVFSGYQYGASYWYSPNAILKTSSGTSITVHFGYDSASNLWVAVPAGNYTGMDVHVTNGHSQVADWSNNISVINEATLTGTIQKTQIIYRPLNYDENAVTATKLQTARAINGINFDGTAPITITANTPATLTRGSYLTGSNFNGSTATTWAVDATSANTASKVVVRDASGNFSAGTITASLSGNASTATTAAAVSLHASNEVNIGGGLASGRLHVNYNDGGNFTEYGFYGGGTALASIFATTFVGALSGTVSATTGSFSDTLRLTKNTPSGTAYNSLAMEVRSTGGHPVGIGFHRSGYTQTILAHEGSGLVVRSGSISTGALAPITASTFVGALTGNASSATYASAVTLTEDNATNATRYPLFVSAATGSLSPRTDTGFTYNPSTGALSSTSFIGALSGNASTATCLLPNYIGGLKPNPQTYFSNTIGLKVAMTGQAGAWSDTLWINGYSGADVPNMVAIHTSRQGTPRMWLSSQNNTGTTYGTLYEVISSYNIANQNVANASSATKVNNNLTLKFDTGTTEGTSLYTFNGSSAKTIDIKAGSNVSISKAAGIITISSTDTNIVYTHPTTSGNKHIPSGGSSGQILRWNSDGTAEWGADNNNTYTAATTTNLGLVKLFNGDVQSIAGNTVTATASRTYGVQVNSSGQLVVNVPWTDNNTTYGIFNTTTNGLVPKTTTSNTTDYLRRDGTWATPPNTDTHYTTGILAGASGTNTAAAVSNPYVKVLDNTTYRSQIRLLGSGGTTISSDSSGNITIKSTSYSNFVGATASVAGTAGLVPAPTIANYTSNCYLKSNGTWTQVNYSHLTGTIPNAPSATYASAVTLTADNSTNATNYPLFVNAATGNLSPRTDTGFTYNPSTGELNTSKLTVADIVCTTFGSFSRLGVGTSVFPDIRMQIHDSMTNANVLILSAGGGGSYESYGPSMIFNDGRVDVASIKGAYTGSDAGSLIFNTRGYDGMTQSLVERMKISNTGLYIIGNINGSGALDINGNIDCNAITATGPLTATYGSIKNGVTNTTTLSSMTTNLLNGGYLKLPSGIIMQYGRYNMGNGATTARFKFPVAFSTATVSVTLTVEHSNATLADPIKEFTTSTVDMNVTASSSTTRYVHIIAFGY